MPPKPSLIPVILSGGSGTRLWPLSRELFPKQLLPLVGERTMLQETLLRLEHLGAKAPFQLASPIVVCNQDHRFLVAEQLREIGQDKPTILLEPCRKNTAPALTLAALGAAERTPKEDSVLLVMPADHVILDPVAFGQAVTSGFHMAEQGHVVTFGVVPTGPETGYGYIKASQPTPNASVLRPTPLKIDAFVEKPDAATATQFVASGEYLWNSGMFMVKAGQWLKAIAHFHPQIATACQSSFQQKEHDLFFLRVNEGEFSQSPSDSIDYAVMERITQSTADGFQSAVIPLDSGWSDVGAWTSIWQAHAKDPQGNVVRGDVHSRGNKNSLIMAEERLVAALGLEDLIVVETADAVLVAHRSHAQDVKQIVEWLKEEKREEHLTHKTVYRPWGNYKNIGGGERYQVKRITVNPGASLSLQMHHHRAEHWVVVKGSAQVTCGEKVFLVSENESTYIPRGEWHQLTNPGKIPLEMVEVQSGGYLNEDDIVRKADSYGRK
ncbi:MAG: mannose-1-phosphate guanylyltransferase/mannose-6-phosphate isomerase [Deltaproteobacteria bacterium]|nr:mannose-1-phosphate guanylyltransferase/mannose-6-phosphate isomerase [Deltaproteobacteria bacterium]